MNSLTAGSSISGITFIKNGLTLGYPIRESIESISPLCAEVVINVGFDDPHLLKDDGTYEYLREHLRGPKYIFLKSYWDPSLTQGGQILAQQTNIGLEKCHGRYCQYIQGDEVVHESDLSLIENGIHQMEQNLRIEGLIFEYLHFYGNVDIIKYTRNAYRREVRLIRNGLGIKSWKDAQGFRNAENRKIWALLTSARIFHYGWARKEVLMKRKVQQMDKLYHVPATDSLTQTQNTFEYRRIWGLKKFLQTHPQVMSDWIKKNRNDLDLLSMPLSLEWQDGGLAISDFIERWTGYRLGEYKNYRLIK